jgi:hypothetical protein
MVYEACAAHFLTDAFSSGHLRTARADMQTHWDGIYPNFRARFINTLGELVGRALYDQASTAHKIIVGSVFPMGAVGEREALILEAIKKVKSTLGAAAPGFGDVISSLCHDTDNVKGLSVINDLGWRWNAFGDDHMLDGKPSGDAGGRSHFEIIRLAVELGCDDIRAAGQLGQQTKGLTPDQIYAEIRHRSKAPAKAGVEHYAPEQLMPRLAESGPGLNGEQQWKAKSFSELLNNKVRTDQPQTFEKAIIESCQSGTFADQFDDVASQQDVAVTVGGVNVGLYPYAAFRAGVVEPLHQAPIKLFHKIIGDE